MTVAKTIRVEVTAEDIAAGVRFISGACPVARALSRRLGWPMRVFIGKRDGHLVGIAHMVNLGAGAEFRLSRSVGAFAHAFDHGQPVEPFTFRVVR